MQIDLTPEQDELVRRAIETGRHRCPEDAVREALALWVEYERRREELLKIT
jgi:Arc/MetJ-type ribon-helix-helix transcriptional regulator